jgi:DNA-binding NarL/FixJ family response regulator
MVDVSALDSVYGALADGSRRTIVWRLAAEGELKVTDIARPVKNYISAILSKTELHDRTQSALFAVRHNLMGDPAS